MRQITYLGSDQFDTAGEITTIEREGPEFSIPSDGNDTIEGTMPPPENPDDARAFLVGWVSTK